MKVNIGNYDKHGTKRKINIKIDEYDVWNLDHTLALIILPCLKKFKSNLSGYPGYFNSDTGMKKWENIIQKMIDAFELIVADDTSPDDFEKHQKIIKKGLKLFAKYYENLWD